MVNYDQSVELYVSGMDKVGVLYSPGFGAGWSTWNLKCYAYDKRIVEKFIEDPELFHREGSDLVAFMTALGYHGYYGGANQLRLEFIPKGTPFRIDSYDGNERIELFDMSNYICF